MGLFGKMFTKKICDICGAEIGLLGNKKLEDGNMCKDCAKKLSPWFDGRRHSTIEQIKAQLAYREANKLEIEKFRPTMELGEDYKVYIDRNAGTFVVNNNDHYVEDNADVFKLSQITSCIPSISDRCVEDTTRDKDGNTVSYNPPRYTYYYDFYVKIKLDHPFIDDVEFKVNNFTVDVKCSHGRSFFSDNNPTNDYEYRKYNDMTNEIVSALTQAIRYNENNAAQAPAAAPQQPARPEPREVTCPYCDSRVVLTPEGRCPNCDAKIE
ncbi:MAG: DUF4428 domain-containing protein [Candidatus Limivicinus sp.]|jgi:DNA-directed RNA polymerase subunit RPC12/RpoP